MRKSIAIRRGDIQRNISRELLKNVDTNLDLKMPKIKKEFWLGSFKVSIKVH